MEIDTERIVALVLFSILHWALAIMLLSDLMKRKRVLGGRKAPWAIVIVLFVFIGSLLYLICHPAIFYGADEDNNTRY